MTEHQNFEQSASGFAVQVANEGRVTTQKEVSTYTDAIVEALSLKAQGHEAVFVLNNDTLKKVRVGGTIKTSPKSSQSR